jgi:hypothetical protein
MSMTDEIRKTLSDPKPLYALAGAGDLAAEKLKDAPERLRDTPTLLAEASATLTTLANKIAAEAPERLAKVSSGVQDAAGKGRPDAQALRGLAQTVAIQQVGRLLEAAGKAVETYDELAERGRVVISRYTGTGAGGESVDGETVPPEQGPVTVLVEQVTDEDELDGAAEAETVEVFDAEPEPETAPADEAAPKPDTAAEAAQVFEEAAVAEAEVQAEQGAKNTAAARKPAAKKAAPRKRAAAPKAPRKPKD